MEERGTNPNAWASAAKLKNANALYNFLSGESRSLSQSTYEQLARVYRVSVSDLTGETTAREVEARMLNIFRILSDDDQARAVELVSALLRAAHTAEHGDGAEAPAASKKALASS